MLPENNEISLIFKLTILHHSKTDGVTEIKARQHLALSGLRGLKVTGQTQFYQGA